MANSGDLPARTAIPFAFLYTRSRSAVEGATRFQKLVFLGQKESELPEEYEYEPDDYGPFSIQLHSDIYWLADLGYIEKREESNGVGNTRHVFCLTRDGIQAAREFAERDTTGRIFDSATEVKREWGEKRVDDLLRYVYNKYEEYTTESDLDLDRLFDPEAKSQFLESDDGGDKFLGPGPGAFKEMNPTADELFSIDQ